MKLNFPYIASLALATLLVACAPSATQEKSAVQQSLTEDEAFRLGVDGYVYGYPLLVMNSVRRVMTNVAVLQAQSAPMGQFGHYRSFPDPSKRDLAGLNFDTLYSTAWLDLSHDPYVLHLPDAHGRFYLMPILDGWSEVIGSPGTRTTGDKAGDYAITGPRWNGVLPSGVTQIKSGTNIVWLVGRTYTSGTAQDYEVVHAMQDQYTLVPLALFGKPPVVAAKAQPDPSVDMATPPRDQIDKLDSAAFFTRLVQLMKDNPPAAADAPMVSNLTRLGIVEGFDFSKLPLPVTQGLARAPDAARKAILAQYSKLKQANGWMVSTASGHYGTDYLSRALVAYIGVGGNAPEDAFYPIARFDGDGKTLNGRNRYVLHFTKQDMPPIDPRGFWSLTMYDDQYFLVPNAAKRNSLSSRDKFAYNPDGSMDLYVQKDSPGADKRSNWLPAPDGDFILMLRLYWPKAEAINGAWVPPPTKRVQ